MAESRVKGRRVVIFYGWIILIYLCFTHFILLCGWLYTYGTTLSAMINDFGSTMTMAAVAKTSNTLACAVLALVVGWIISKYSAKLVIILGGVAGTIGSAMMVWYVDTMPQYIFCCTMLLSVMATFGSGVASQTILSNWFQKKRGMVLAILLSSGAVGGFVFPTLTSFLMERTGTWRSIWVFILIGNIMSIFLSAIILRDKPEEMSTYPDGIKPDETTMSSSEQKVIIWKNREFMRTPLFCAIVFVYTCTNFSINCMTAYSVAAFTEKGMSLSQASLVLSIYAFVNFFTRLLSGVAMAKWNPKNVYSCSVLILAAACAMVPFVSSPNLAYCFGALFGFAFGFTVIGPQTLILKAFGVENFSTISSVYMTISQLITAALSIFPGIIRDLTGSFNLLYIFLAIALIMGGFAIIKAGDMMPQHERVEVHK